MIEIVGGAIAGSLAALRARQAGAPVRIWEKSKFPRHKVCGEFLSGEIAPVLSSVGLWSSFQALHPAPLDSVSLYFQRWTRTSQLPVPAWGLSRYQLDQFLLDAAVAAGAELRQELAPLPLPHRPMVLAHGRRSTQTEDKGNRIFGFKAHFEGPANSAVELYFFAGGYVGVNAIENGLVNVCGLASEALLRSVDFDPQRLFARHPALQQRTASFRPLMKWLQVGPLRYGHKLAELSQPGLYPAGDALSFVDPFTGSGQLAAMVTGLVAGQAAAEGWSVEQYRRACRNCIARQSFSSGVIRAAILQGWAEWVGPFVPARLLFRATRPAHR